MLNSLNNYSALINTQNKFNWEIEFNFWYKNWNYKWEYIETESGEKIEHWNWILSLKDSRNKLQYYYEGYFDNWIFQKWLKRKYNNGIEYEQDGIFDKKWNFVKWQMRKSSVIYNWDFKDDLIYDWEIIDLKTKEKIFVKNWEYVDKNLQNQEINSKTNEKIEEFIYYTTKAQEVFNDLVELYLSANNWETNEKISSLEDVNNILQELKLTIPDVLSNLSVLKPEIIEEVCRLLDDVVLEVKLKFLKYWFSEFDSKIDLFTNSVDELKKQLKLYLH